MGRRAKIFSSVQMKFAATYILLIVALLVLLNTYPLIVSRDLVFSAKETTLVTQAQTIAHALVVAGELDDGQVGETMAEMVPSGQMRVMVQNMDGVLFFDNHLDAMTFSTPQNIHIPEGIHADRLLAWQEGYDVFTASYTEGLFHAWAASPIYRADGETILGVVLVYEQDPAGGALIEGIQRNVQSISVVVFLGTLFLAFVFSRTLTARLTAMLAAIRAARGGDYAHKLTVRGKDELAELGASFNSLTEKLGQTDETRRRFVSDASHELKTPLASIRLLSDSILQNDGMEKETVLEFVADIGQEADRLARITEKLLNLTRLDAKPDARASTVDIGDVIRRVRQTLLPLAGQHSVNIQLDLADGCTLSGSEDTIHQIVFNLVENAIKYNTPGGSVFVILREKSGEITLTVDDTGMGIPETDLPHIFDRFYRVDKARTVGGAGIGLSIVKAAVREMGGQIEVSPQAAGGTRFQVQLISNSE